MKISYRLCFFICLVLISAFGCNNLYKAGNLVQLGYPVETRLDGNIVSTYIDTLTKKFGYAVPEKWADERKLVDLDSINHKRIYFKNDPEEMYLISLGGMVVIADVYNERIRRDAWVAQRDSMPALEEKRVKERFKKEILDVIEAMAKKDGLPDSVIYKQPF